MATRPAPRAPKAASSMCLVTIGGLMSVVMPTDKGLKVMDLLQHAIECQPDYIGGSGYVYKLQDHAVQTELKIVQANQLRAAKPQQRDPLLLGRDQ